MRSPCMVHLPIKYTWVKDFAKRLHNTQRNSDSEDTFSKVSHPIPYDSLWSTLVTTLADVDGTAGLNYNGLYWLLYHASL